jgi:hypothetical protein
MGKGGGHCEMTKSKMPETPPSPRPMSPFDRFKTLIRGIVAVPKKEIEAEEYAGAEIER